TCANVPVRTGPRVARFCPGRTGRMRLVPESVSTSPRTRSTQVSPARPEIQRLTVPRKAPARIGDTPTRGYRTYLGTSAFPTYRPRIPRRAGVLVPAGSARRLEPLRATLTLYRWGATRRRRVIGDTCALTWITRSA